ncbi:MAG: hypothetical protein ABW133_25885, partial [Polyangiaceae bacterium]
MQKSREKAWKLLVSATPFAVACVSAIACYSMDPPATAPKQDLLADPPPGSPASSADPTTMAPTTLKAGPPEEEHKKMVFDEAQAKVVLARAATNAHSCVEVVDKGQPHGTGTVLVKFSGTGKSTDASIAAPF